jgi:thiamine biosynthesis lipoprotein
MKPDSHRFNLMRAICLFVSFFFASCAEAPQAKSEFVLGTLCSVNLFEGGSAGAYREIFARFREIEARMSANKDGTQIDSINRSAGIAPVPVDQDVLQVILAALDFSDRSQGAFDPTVGSLVSLWGIGSDAARIPEPEEIQEALSLIDRGSVRIDAKAGTVFLMRKGMRLDLGAIAKGYAADEAARIIRKRGIQRAIIDLGGNVLAYGTKKGGLPWRIGVQDPSGLRGAYLGILQIKDSTMVTSGVYERFLEADGKRYHHILSTADGYPVRNGLLSVTILAKESMAADALSTSVFALGYEKGSALLAAYPGAEAIYVFEDMTVRTSPGIAESFQLTDDRFVLVKGD